MTRDTSYRDFILDQLRDLNGLTSRAMFGGHGLYHDGVFFGLVSSQDVLYFKTDPDSVDEYRARGMDPFQPGKDQILKNYYEVPADIIEDQELLIAWAKRARIAQPPKKSPKKGARPTP